MNKSTYTRLTVSQSMLLEDLVCKFKEMHKSFKDEDEMEPLFAEAL